MKTKIFLKLVVSALAPHASAGVRPSTNIRGYSTNASEPKVKIVGWLDFFQEAS
jgi:hypothetical protein